MANIMTKEETKYDLEDLVKIGDAIHNSTASFIVVANRIGETFELTTSLHGEYEKVIQMLVYVFENDPKLTKILYDVNKTLIANKLDQI